MDKLNVVIADDHPIVLVGVRELVERDERFCVAGQATCSNDLVALLDQVRVDLVITDFNMPKLDGLGLLRAIRAHGPTSKTAVIMLTGRADRELVQRAVQFGVNNYLVKPFTTQTLKEKIEAVFGPLT